jgi:hypothetical protein
MKKRDIKKAIFTAVLIVVSVLSVALSAAITAEDLLPPLVTNPSANPDTILNDGVETSQLNVTVTDASPISSVTVDLSSIGGSAIQPMTNIPGTDIYTVTTTAAPGTVPATYYLGVNATDVYGNSNTAVSIELTVRGGTAVSIGNGCAVPGGTAIVPLMISDVTNMAAAVVNLTFNESVVDVTAVSDSQFDQPPNLVNRGPGWVLLQAGQFMTGLDGNILMCNVTLEAVGNEGETSALDLTDVRLEGMDMTPIGVGAVINGTFTISADTTPPVITNVNAVIVYNTATITWDTDDPSDSLVKYGTESGNLDHIEYDPAIVTSHSIELTDLIPSTTYYAVNSTNTAGLSSESGEYSFTTPSMPTVAIDDCTVDAGEETTTPIMINYVEDVGVCEIKLIYDASVVHVTDVTDGDFDFMITNIDNVNGITPIGAIQLVSPGLSGNVTLCDVTLQAVGNAGDTSPLDIMIEQMTTATPPITDIPAVTDNGTFIIPSAPDLIVVSITPNCGYMFANESNEIHAKIENVGAAPAGVSNASFVLSDGYSEKVPVPALAAGANTTVCITDPTIRNAGDGMTITVTADCNGEVDELNESNNESSIVEMVVNNGYKSKRYTGGSDITTWKTFELKGSLLYSLGDSYYLSSYSYPNWTTYNASWNTSDLPVPDTATVEEARLYVPYTWDKKGVIPDNVSLTFNGIEQILYAHYSDEKGWATSYPYGMLAYNVTGNFSTGGNVANLTNSYPGGGNVSMRGMLLVVIYADESEPERQIYVNEEFDLLYGGSSKCTTPAEATAYAPFDAIDLSKVANATLITVAPGAGPTEGELIFNGHVWTDVWNFAGDSQIGIDDRDVTTYLNETANEAGFQSSADYMEASNAILVVTALSAPTITGFAPESPVTTMAGDELTFNITIGQSVNVSWQINGTEVQTNTSVTEASFATTGVTGTWNVSAIVSNPNGMDMQTWIWNVVEPAIVDIDDATAPPGGSVTTPIMIYNVTNVGSVLINLTFNASVVHVTNVSGSEFDFMDATIDNTTGFARIGAMQLASPGMDGDVKLCDVELLAVGSVGESSPLDLEIEELKDATPEGNDIPAIVDCGLFTIAEVTPPTITNPSANPDTIPDDTDNDPRCGEKAQLNVTVTDDSGVESVLIDLSVIGGSATAEMTNIEGDIWSIGTNASAGCIGTYELRVNATDIYGNYNDSTSITLRVLNNGDVSEDGDVTLYDAFYLARHVLGKPGFEYINKGVAEVSGDCALGMHDAMYLAKHVLGKPGFEILH